MTDPWQSTSNESRGPTALPSGEAPPVVLWFKIYCVACSLMYLGVLAGGAFMMAAPQWLESSGEDTTVLAIQGAFMIVLGLVLTGLYLTPLFLRPSKGAWILGIVCIGLTLTSCCFLPFGIPLLIYWLKPETKTYYGA